jgi:hypothetical protein
MHACPAVLSFGHGRPAVAVLLASTIGCGPDLAQDMAGCGAIATTPVDCAAATRWLAAGRQVSA